jgi:hypothetical protein
MKKENDRRNHVGTTFEMAFDTTPGFLLCEDLCEDKQEDGVVIYSVIPALWKLKISFHS